MLALIVAVALIAVADGFASFGSRLTRASTPLSALEKDSQGYLVKPRDWFNGTFPAERAGNCCWVNFEFSGGKVSLKKVWLYLG
jgi:hypothetical protein